MVLTQPSVARALIELPASVEKGLTQRFLWIFPKPSFANFDSLELIEEKFSSYLGELITRGFDLTTILQARALHAIYCGMFIVV